MGSFGAQRRASATAHATRPSTFVLVAQVGGDVEGDCQHAPGMKRTADEVTVLLMSLATAAAGYDSG
ncbi:hypothetical protein SETIT_2G410000v2 [Setaria italica]|uniref:Uncharacterized protein n=1 Tax=Setaria italica TaxID=4555 RepID=A0A368Q8Q0_SETIT|nr:hypothetical protein SETIT_2G410000v2 [Setaria italica]